jgi:hypothetical protein
MAAISRASIRHPRPFLTECRITLSGRDSRIGICLYIVWCRTIAMRPRIEPARKISFFDRLTHYGRTFAAEAIKSPKRHKVSEDDGQKHMPRLGYSELFASKFHRRMCSGSSFPSSGSTILRTSSSVCARYARSTKIYSRIRV